MDSTSTAAADAPPIHLQQTLIDKKDGQVPQEKLYRDALANCRQGSVPVKPLDEESAGKLGRTYIEAWYEGDRMAVREDRWSYDVDQMCLFKPVHRQSLTIVDAKGTAALVNYRVQGRYYVVDRLFDTAELRLGLKHQDMVRISRTGEPASGRRGS